MGEINEIEYQIEALERSIASWEKVIPKIKYLERSKAFLIQIVEEKKAKIQRRRDYIKFLQQTGDTASKRRAPPLHPALPPDPRRASIAHTTTTTTTTTATDAALSSPTPTSTTLAIPLRAAPTITAADAAAINPARLALMRRPSPSPEPPTKRLRMDDD
ncbi:MAG: hypothetical protein M1821_001631 [Bathelium mastoideum]|nr:MAG: hypothetical protein M1821_001631 [Bathelium mastoideum]KAI9691519.1 MAG: hypothetical protein M1822_007590 [Bathelium mastoideum]